MVKLFDGGRGGWGWGLLMTGWQIQSEYWGVVGGSCDINYHDFNKQTFMKNITDQGY